MGGYFLVLADPAHHVLGLHRQDDLLGGQPGRRPVRVDVVVDREQRVLDEPHHAPLLQCIPPVVDAEALAELYRQEQRVLHLVPDVGRPEVVVQAAEVILDLLLGVALRLLRLLLDELLVDRGDLERLNIGAQFFKLN